MLSVWLAVHDSPCLMAVHSRCLWFFCESGEHTQSPHCWDLLSAIWKALPADSEKPMSVCIFQCTCFICIISNVAATIVDPTVVFKLFGTAEVS